MLVVNFADDFLHHVFHGDDARGGAVFVHHHRHVRAFFLHLAQQIVHRFVSGTARIGRTISRTLRCARCSSFELEHIAHVHEACDLIDVLFVHRDAGVLLVNHQLRSSSSDASCRMATMRGRGVITSRTVLSPNATTD